MNLDSLQLFVAVATHRSFSRAAQDFGMHRSAVSRRVAALERELGVDLLLRTTRSVEPTTAGQALLAEVGPLLGRVQRALVQLPEAADEPAGTLRIAAPRDIGMCLLPEVLGELARTHPRITPAVELSNRLVDLRGERFDVALRISQTQLEREDVRARRLGPIRVSLLAAPEYVERRGAPKTREEVATHTMVGLGEVLPDLEPQAFVSAGDMLLAAELAIRGVGLALLPDFVVRDEVSQGRLVRLLPDQVWVPKAELYLTFPNTSRLPAKSAAFRDEVLRFFERHPLTPGAPHEP